MRHITILLCALLAVGHIAAQPKWAKKASQAVFTLKTFKADGTLLASTNGFFISDDGEAISNYTPFIGASTAIAYNAKGKEMEVECITGANETYNMVKLRIKAKDVTPLTITTDSTAASAPLWILPYSVGKKIVCYNTSVDKTEAFKDSFNYYSLATPTADNGTGCPVLNEAGIVVAVVQEASATKKGTFYAVDARFARDMKITGLSINSDAFRKTAVKMALPAELDQAVLTLYVAGQSKDSLTYATIIDDFIAAFPNAADGYTARARQHSLGFRYAEANKDMLKAIEVAEKKDDAHYNYSRLIYDKALNHAEVEYAPWTFDKAVEETEKAYAINPVAIYMQMKAEIRFTEKRYAEAYDVFEELTKQGHRTADIFLDAARCKQMLNDTTAVLALMDSTVNTFSKPYLKEAAPYIFARAQTLMAANKHRQAVMDLNEYEKLLSTEVNANFYYIRSQAEINGRLYQLALNDLNKAITMTPGNTFFMSEKASLEVRVKLYDEAIETARAIIAINPDISDGHLFLGLAQCLKGNKTEGKASLEKAKAMGDEQAEELIAKYAM